MRTLIVESALRAYAAFWRLSSASSPGLAAGVGALAPPPGPNDAAVRPAEGERAAEALRLSHRDVRAHLPRRLQDAERGGLAAQRDEQRPLPMGIVGEGAVILDDAEEVRALDYHRGGVAPDGLRARRVGASIPGRGVSDDASP